MEKLDQSDRILDLKEALAFGHHNGANGNQELLKKLVERYIFTWLWTCSSIG
jgi:hypothetical protein